MTILFNTYHTTWFPRPSLSASWYHFGSSTITMFGALPNDLYPA
ncbi:hypothetical protein [Vibrio variabilis]|nr:hypothetical protein [Vibrio variabilis]